MFSLPFLFAFLPCHSSGLSFLRIVGIFFEVFGLYTVITSLSKESKKYNHPGYRTFFVSWVASFKNIFRPPVANAITLSASGGGSMSGSAEIEIKRNFQTIEEKVDFLLEEIDLLKSKIRFNTIKIAEVNRNLENKIEEVKVSASSLVMSLQNEIKEKAVGDYYFLISGSLLTVLGILLTNVPDDIYKYLFKFS